MASKKQFNKVVGLSLVTAGLVLCGFGLYAILNPITLADVEKAMPAEAYVKNCQNSVNQLGFTSTTDGKSVTVKSDSLDNPQEQLTKTSLAISLCEGLELKSFCMGQVCTSSKIQFKLNAASAS